MGVGPETGGGGGRVRDHVDPEGRTAEAGLQDVGAGKPEIGLPRPEEPTLEDGEPGVGHHAGEGQLVHPEGGARRPRPRVADPGQIERGLERPVLTRSPVAAVDGDVENHRPGPAPPAAGLGEAPVGPDRQPDGLGPAGHAVEEVGRLQGGRNPEPVPGLRPVEADHVAVRPDQGPGHLETGQDADVVLGGRAPEDDGDGGDGGGQGAQG